MEMSKPHWEQRLVRGFPTGRTSTVTIEVDPSTNHGGMVLLASRLEGIFDALKPRQESDDDPLTGEDTEDLLRLLDHLHRVLGVLTAQEDRVLDALRARGVSSHQAAAAMQVDHKTVLNRWCRIDRAAAEGVNSLAYSENRTAELSD